MIRNGKLIKFEDLNPERFMVAGDTHGSTPHMQKLFKFADRFGIDTIVQVGDFGFVWPNLKKKKRDAFGNRLYEVIGYPEGDTRLDTLNRLAEDAGVMILFLDGNHEDFDRLDDLGAYPDSESSVQIMDNIIYLPRGFSWVWNDIKFMSSERCDNR